MRFSILTLCFAPLAVLASGNEFQELQQLLGQFSTLGNSLIVQDSAADLAPAANVCWKEIKLGGGGRKTPESSSSCAVGYELSAGRCYVPCSTGYRGWGPFCISTDANAASRSYQRGNGKAFDAKSNEDKFAVSESCPSALPFQCGVFCTADLKTCSSESAALAVSIFKIGAAIQKGDVGAVLAEGKELLAKVTKWPKCSVLSTPNTGFEQLARLFHQINA